MAQGHFSTFVPIITSGPLGPHLPSLVICLNGFAAHAADACTANAGVGRDADGTLTFCPGEGGTVRVGGGLDAQHLSINGERLRTPQEVAEREQQVCLVATWFARRVPRGAAHMCACMRVRIKKN